MNVVSPWKTCVLIVLSSWMLVSCAGPQQKETATPEGPETAEAAPSEQVLQVQRSDDKLPETPKGCQTEHSASSFGLTCESVRATLSRGEIPAGSDNVAMLILASVEQGYKDAGWSITRTGDTSMSYDGKSLPLASYEVAQGSTKVELVVAPVESKPHGNIRSFTCKANAGALPDEHGCAGYLKYLQSYAHARRTVGLAIRGKAVDIPSDCQVADKSVRCGHDVVSWSEFPLSTSDQVIDAPMRKLRALFKERNAKMRAPSASCRFEGKPIDCEVVAYQLPGYREQAAVMAAGKVGNKKVRLICDIVQMRKPMQLPEPCSLLFEAKFSEE